MRESRFRGYSVDQKKWVYGGLIMAEIPVNGKPYCEIHTPFATDPSVYATGVDPESVGQWVGFPDKNLNDLYEGDLCIGYARWMTGDGKLRKGYPDKIRVILQIKWSDGKNIKAGFYLDNLGPHPDDKFACDKYFYRSYEFRLQEDRDCELKNNKVVWKGYCESLEKIGNAYENADLIPELDYYGRPNKKITS